MKIDAERLYSPIEIEKYGFIPSRTKFNLSVSRHTVKQLVLSKKLKGTIIKKEKRNQILIKGSDILEYLKNIK